MADPITPVRRNHPRHFGVFKSKSSGIVIAMEHRAHIHVLPAVSAGCALRGLLLLSRL